ncbi:MAG: aspartate-semialdehyde dehydrogenase family protein [Candidatus Aenigmatarchaeota archaeon]
MRKLSVGLVGATGEVGRSFVGCLSGHPFFQLNDLYASERSAGKRYGDIVQNVEMTEGISNILVKKVSEIDVKNSDIYFSALPGSEAHKIEEDIAKLRPVFSTTSAHRYEADVPIIVPGANEEHYRLLNEQKQKRGWKGFVCPQSNCTTVGLAISLKPLYEIFGIQSVLMASQQAVSGAGRELEEKWHEQRKQQGVNLPSAVHYSKKTDEPVIEGNVIPYIKNEEEKVIKETKKILGNYSDGRISEAAIKIAARCNRVPVKDGHSEDVFAFLEKPFSIEDVISSWKSYKAEYQKYNLPSAPSQPIVYLEDAFSPQPRFDITREDGMAVVIGRAQKNELDGLQYKVISHNTKLGAAKGCVLTAEYLCAEGAI